MNFTALLKIEQKYFSPAANRDPYEQGRSFKTRQILRIRFAGTKEKISLMQEG